MPQTLVTALNGAVAQSLGANIGAIHPLFARALAGNREMILTSAGFI
jgi:hypothetical protein